VAANECHLGNMNRSISLHCGSRTTTSIAPNAVSCMHRAENRRCVLCRGIDQVRKLAGFPDEAVCLIGTVIVPAGA